MADIMKLLQQAQQMQGRLQQIQDELQQRTVSASAGGGMVTVNADGKGQIRSIKIDPSVVNPSDVEMLEDLIVVAMTDVQRRAAALAQEEMGKLTGGLGLPFQLPL
ncbi:MAG TPA: YbaB/EbfC family nucleoid-associated protein [Gemmatimonadaceae bacterium]|jgi:DNA-binding YbaB/EbfC family protein|nr:YbaB/EbfC family nucleoid-associated protein [Gemmatimonadaceae bacterium]HTA72867.1 YbaB/EbfC family nucleoid-associated protein [Gemmatimonadaceae bacterium]HXB23407.1 YbaB/EbfC family nucleoid-associated protein [Gemmatimonadaceae bacterium]